MINELDMVNLPQGWRLGNLKQVAEVVYRYPTFFGMEHLSSGVPVIRGEHLQKNGSISHDWEDYWYVSKEISNRFPKTITKANDLIMSVRGSIGKLGIVDQSLEGSQVSPNCLRISINQNLSIPKYIYYFFSSVAFKISLNDNVNSTTIATIKASSINTIPIPLPPLDEQQRIVARIEELFTQLDAGVAALEAVRGQVKRYRQAVLQSAIDGDFTKDWRLGHQNTSSTVSSDLPDGWTWTTVEALGKQGEQAVLTGPFGASLGREDFIQSGVPVLTIGCLTGEGLSVDKAMFISNEKAAELYRYSVKTGDLLFSRMASVGRAEVVPGKFAGSIINYHLMRLRLSDDQIDPRYFLAYVRGSKYVRNYIREVNHGATRDGINTTQLLQMPIRLPPIEEQQEISMEVERCLSVADELEKTIDQSLRQAARLRQSILQRAFCGRL